MDIPIAATKLLLGIVAFVLIGWLGARDKRIGGVLFTFPLLNGIAMLTGADPLGIAGTIYLVVLWNGGFFLLLMDRFEALPPLPQGLHREARIIIRIVVWMALWAVGATALAVLRDTLSFPGWLFLLQLVAAGLWIARRWRAPPPAAALGAISFRLMWLNWSGVFRVACFIAVFLLLLGIAAITPDARWIGWASAVPLPGIFALATLSATQARDELKSLGDTVLLGPLLVIPFNWLLSRAIVELRLQAAGNTVEIVTVVAFWAVAAGIVFALVPAFARWRDGRRESGS
jgi:hypothetical protein